MNNQFWQVFSVLYRYPAFGRLWIGRLISLFGDALTLIALPWFVLQVTESGTATAGILLTLQLPAILTSTVIGSLIDRFQPRAIIAIDNGNRTLIIGLIPVLYWFGQLELWLLFLLTFLAGMLVPATEVGSRSVLPNLVDDKDLDTAGICTFHQRDCPFSNRLHPGRFGWTCIPDIPRLVASLCGLRLLSRVESVIHERERIPENRGAGSTPAPLFSGFFQPFRDLLRITVTVHAKDSKIQSLPFPKSKT